MTTYPFRIKKARGQLRTAPVNRIQSTVYIRIPKHSVLFRQGRMAYPQGSRRAAFFENLNFLHESRLDLAGQS